MRCGGKTRLCKARENMQPVLTAGKLTAVLSGSKNALALSAVRQNKTKKKNLEMLGKFMKYTFSTADAAETWSVAEAAKKLQKTVKKRNEWSVAFKEGVKLNDKVVQDTFEEHAEEDFIARYDLSFLTPRSQAIRCKVHISQLITHSLPSIVSLAEFRSRLCSHFFFFERRMGKVFNSCNLVQNWLFVVVVAVVAFFFCYSGTRGETPRTSLTLRVLNL